MACGETDKAGEELLTSKNRMPPGKHQALIRAFRASPTLCKCSDSLPTSPLPLLFFPPQALAVLGAEMLLLSPTGSSLAAPSQALPRSHLPHFCPQKVPLPVRIQWIHFIMYWLLHMLQYKLFRAETVYFSFVTSVPGHIIAT